MSLLDHLPILPILLPMLVGTLMLLPPLHDSIKRQRILSAAINLTLVLIACALVIISHTSGSMLYMLGEWHPPYGILLVADRLSAALVLLTSILAFCANLYASAGEDNQGEFFHPLFMFQVMGINGAFLTGDIFNLFVFFEILLIASYALLVHGGGKWKTEAGIHYVILNLIGSAFFLFALGTLYGSLGTLSMADMVDKVKTVAAEDVVLVKVGALLLLLVFGLKAAMLPLHFWLTRTYIAASIPVAALFAIMTKVGIYSIWRIHTSIFGDTAGIFANIIQNWIWPLALLTLIVGMIGTLASETLRKLAANLIIVSIGSLLLTIALNSQQATAAGIYYLLHSTLISAALFLIAGLINQQRGQANDRFVAARRMPQATILSILFMVAALTVIGMPPFSGFVGKALILKAAETEAEMMWLWPIMLIASLAALIALSRAGTTLFWRVRPNVHTDGNLAAPRQLIAIGILLGLSPLLVIFGGPVTEFTNAAAAQIHNSLSLSDVQELLGVEP